MDEIEFPQFLWLTVLKLQKFSLTEKKNSSNQLFSDFFSKTIAFTKFLRKKCEREFAAI